MATTLRLELYEHHGEWSLQLSSDRYTEKICDLDAGGEWSAVNDAASLLEKAFAPHIAAAIEARKTETK